MRRKKLVRVVSTNYFYVQYNFNSLTMKTAVITSLLVASASAFAPVAQPKASNTVAQASLDDIGGATAPLKNFDPLRLSQLGTDETLAWFRAAELKHSRVAMLATTGYIVQAAGFHFPGMLSDDISFESLSAMKPFDAWDAVPDIGKFQVIASIFVAEIATESKPVHYTKGGPLPQIVFPPVDFSNVSDERIAKQRCKELNNGRLAMIAIMGFIANDNIPGAVPLLN